MDQLTVPWDALDDPGSTLGVPWDSFGVLYMTTTDTHCSHLMVVAALTAAMPLADALGRATCVQNGSAWIRMDQNGSEWNSG